MQLAGKYGMGVLSIASTSTEGIAALPTQWGFAEEAAATARPDRHPPTGA
jgi:limonene 1,2-monooxygenase